MEIGKLVFELLSEALGLNPNYLNGVDCGEGLSLVCHYYPPCPQPNLAIGTSEHTDNSFITVLLQDHIGGLQIRHENNWVDIPPVAGALVVNIGDLMQASFSTISHYDIVNFEHIKKVHYRTSLEAYGALEQPLFN